jgi:hypothetical protein
MLVRLGKPRVRMVAIVLAALGVAIFGVVRLVDAFTVANLGPLNAVAHVDGLDSRVVSASWVQMDHDMSANAPGYQMPPAMMPGMPQGDDQRLAVSIAVTNTTGETRPLIPEDEFVLHANSKEVPANSGSFGDLPRLAPRNAIDGVLYFDLPPADLVDSSSWLEWTHDGTSTRLALPLNGAVPTHSHGP